MKGSASDYERLADQSIAVANANKNDHRKQAVAISAAQVHATLALVAKLDEIVNVLVEIKQQIRNSSA